MHGQAERYWCGTCWLVWPKGRASSVWTMMGTPVASQWDQHITLCQRSKCCRSHLREAISASFFARGGWSSRGRTSRIHRKSTIFNLQCKILECGHSVNGSSDSLCLERLHLCVKMTPQKIRNIMRPHDHMVELGPVNSWDMYNRQRDGSYTTSYPGMESYTVISRLWQWIGMWCTGNMNEYRTHRL